MTTAPVRGIHHDVRNAWISLAFFPVSFVLAMVGGEGLLSLAGYESSAGGIPWLVILVIGVPMVLLAVSPLAVSAWFAERARREHVPGAVVPLVVSLTLGVGFILQNVFAAIVAAIFG
ncbi:MAG: hypothetical protein ACXVW6_05945 [Nocardioidaceae bacterium]